MISYLSLGYDEAHKAIRAGMDAAIRFGRPMAFAVLDHAGELIASARMDGVPARVQRQALRKAHTAAKMGRHTLTLKRDLQDRANTLADWGDPEFTTLQGGLVVKVTAKDGSEQVVGAVACGGGTIETDEEVARIMLRATGFQVALDERLLVTWQPDAFDRGQTERRTFELPVSPRWLAKGQEPLTAVRCRGVIHTAGIPGIDLRTGELPADPEAQFALAFRNLRTLLEIAGVSRAEEIGLVTYYVPDAAYRKYINKPWMELFPGQVRPARKTNQIPLPAGMVVQVQAVAVLDAQLESLEIPGLFHRDPLPMGARLGPLVFSSVIGGQDPANGKNIADPVGQIECAFRNIRLFMEQAEAGLDQVNHVWVFMQDHFPYHDQMVDAWVRTFPDEHSRPARKTVPYSGLSGETHIQVQVSGVLGPNRRTNIEVEDVHHIDPIPMGSAIGKFLHSSGIGGLDPAKGRNWKKPVIHSTEAFMVDGGVVPQTEVALEHVGTLMRNARGTLDDVAGLTVLLRRLEDAPAILGRLRRVFPEESSFPAVKFINYKLPAHIDVQLHVAAVLA